MVDESSKYSANYAPLWLVTFADLMSLLLCFFVLLLSFATMDAHKFRKLAESLGSAFGDQKIISVVKIPVGETIVAQDFPLAITTPVLIDEIRLLKYQQSMVPNAEEIELIKEQILQAKILEVTEQSQKIRVVLTAEIAKGLVSVISNQLNIIIRINEQGSFPSGAAVLKAGFEPVMDKITVAVSQSKKGIIYVTGHTDDVPIATDWYRSNWELSASRSVTVAHFMLDKQAIKPNRIVIQGYADTKPLMINSSSENRAKNRRVEIIITQKDPTVGLSVVELTQMIQGHSISKKVTNINHSNNNIYP